MLNFLPHCKDQLNCQYIPGSAEYGIYNSSKQKYAFSLLLQMMCMYEQGTVCPKGNPSLHWSVHILEDIRRWQTREKRNWICQQIMLQAMLMME
jgi:hypothetical protein